MGLHFSPLNRGGVGERPETPYRASSQNLAPPRGQSWWLLAVGWWAVAVGAHMLTVEFGRIMNST